MSFDTAKYLENLQRKYGVEGSVLNDSSYKNSIVETNQEQYKQGNFGESFFGTISEATSNIGKGFLGTFEDILDFGASIVGNVGGLFNQDFKENVEDFISTDYSSLLIDDYLKYIDVTQYASRFLNYGDLDISDYDLRDYSAVQYLPELGQNIVVGTEQGIGQIGAILTMGALGTNLGNSGAKVLANSTLFSSSAGRGVQESLQEGEDLGKATVYGLLSGAVELATEKIVGGALSKVAGGGLLDKPINKAISKLVNGNGTSSTILKHVLKIGIDSIGEGLEEVASGMIDPLLRRITNMQNQTNYTASQAFEDFMAGALTSAITMGVTETQNYRKAGGKNQYASQIVANDINEINEKAIEDVEKYVDRAKQLGVKVDNKQIDSIIEKANEKTKPLFDELKRFQLNIQNFADSSVETSEEVTETPVEQTETSIIDHKTTDEYKSLDTHQKWLTTRYFNSEKGSDAEIKYFNQLPANIRDKFRDLKYNNIETKNVLKVDLKEEQNNIDTKLYKDSQSLREKTKYNKTNVETIVKTVNKFINFYLGEKLVNISSETKVDKLYNKIKRISLDNEINESNVDIFTEAFTEDILTNIKIDEWGLDEWLSDEEYENVVNSLKKGFTNLFLNKGDQSSIVTDLKERINNLKDKIKEQKRRYADLKERAKALIQLERLEAQTKKKADWRDKNNVVGANIAPFFSDAYKILLSGGKLVSSTRLKVPELQKNVRERVKQYRDNFYNIDNFADKGLIYNNDIGTLIDNIANGTAGTDLSTQEILDLRKIIRNFNRIVSDYNKVRINGKMVELKELGNKQNDNITAYLGNKETKWGQGAKYGLRTFFRRMNRFFSTPYYVFQSFDLGNPDGAMSKILVDKINKGETAKDTMIKEIIEYKNKNIDEKYIKNLKNEVEFEFNKKTIKIDKGTLLSLYTGLQREWAMKHYEQTGIIEFEDLNGVRHQIEGYDPDILKLLEEKKVITEQDKEVSKHLIQMYKIMANYKSNTDTQILGFSNIEEGVYYPIHTRSSARPQNVDSSMQSMMKNLIRGFGFNKKTISTKGSLFFENCFETLSNYMVNMGRYVAYADAITSTNRYLNTNISEDINNPRYMKDVYLEKVDDKFLSYLTDYFQDIQGLKTGKQDLKWISTVRSNFSKAVLYANPKVVFQQLSAIPSFLTHTSIKSLGKSVVKVLSNPMKAIKTMKENSASAYVRYDGTQLVDAMVNSTDTNKRRTFMRAFDNVAGAGISFMDSFALAIGYQACINESNGDIDKGKQLFEEAVRTSQPNTSISGASQARRGGELAKTISMFTSQTQQNSTMVLSALQELQYAQRMLKISKEGKVELEHNTQYYEDLVNKAKRKMKKYSVGFITQATMVTLIAMAINYAIGKNDDDEETFYEIFGKGMLENTLGSWNPIVNFIVNQVVNEGKYDFQLNTVTAINEAFDAMNDSIKLISNLISQKEVKTNDIVGIFRGISKIAGIPLDNIIKYGNWIVSWFTPETALKLNNALYGVNASSSTTKLNTYISKGQENLAKQQLKDMMATYKTGATSNDINNELYRLYSNGYDVLPSSVMSTIEINGEEYDMTLIKNKSRFMSVYSNATKAVENLYKSSYYRYLSDEAKAKAIKRVYDAYYSSAKLELSNGKYIVEGKFNALVASLGDTKANNELIASLSVYMAKINEIEGDNKETKKEKVVKFINSLKISKQMKYLLYVTAGYKISQREESSLKSYLKQKNVDENTINVLIN